MSAKRKNDTPTYTAFSAYMKHIVQVNLPYRHGPTPLQQLANELGVHPSAASDWLRGKVLGRHPLTEANFEHFLELYFGKPGLENYDILQWWVANGPERFQRVAQQPRWRFRAQLQFPPHYVPRKKILSEMRQRFREARNENVQIMGLVGPPGVGKTTLMRAWALEMREREEFSGVFEIVDPEGEGVDWARSFWRIRPLSTTADRGRLFLVDDLKAYKHLDTLVKHLQSQDFVVFTSRLEKVAQYVLPRFMVTVGPLEQREALDLAQRFLPSWQEEDEGHLLQLGALVNWNVFGLLLGLSDAARYGWEATFCRLQHPPEPRSEVETFLGRLFWMNYETLGREGAVYQEAFAKLGGVPYFRVYSTTSLAAIWDVSFEQALSWANIMARETELMAKGSSDQWQLHEQAYHFAQQLFSRLPPEARASVKRWMKRQSQMPAFQERKRALANARVKLRFPSPAARCSGKHVLKRVWERARFAESTEWRLMKETPRWFTSDEFVLGYALEQRPLNKIFSLWVYLSVLGIGWGMWKRLSGYSWGVFTLGMILLGGYLLWESAPAERQWQALLGPLSERCESMKLSDAFLRR